MFSEHSCSFRWRAFREWRSALEDIFGRILTPELEAKIRQNAPRIEYRDNREAFEELAGLLIDSMIPKEKLNEFRRRYLHIRVYHACRPDNVSNYYAKGLFLRSKNVQIERFRLIFLSGRFPELTEKMLQQSIKELGSYSDDEEELCLAIDDKWLIEQCGHYLIYGSEYLLSLINNLPIEKNRKCQYLSVLREIGRPTILEIDLPNTTAFAKDCNIHELIQDMITEWVYNIAHSRTQSGSLDFTLSLSNPLSPEQVCSHYHPRRIPDPHMGHKIYDAETGEYGPTRP